MPGFTLNPSPPTKRHACSPSESKRSLRQAFGDDFSGSAFQTIDGERYIVGKWGRISRLEDGTYDVWFVGPALAPLSPQKMAVIRQKMREEGGLRELTGEAYTQGRGRAFVLAMAPLCGVRRKRKAAKRPCSFQRRISNVD